jgi:hypothetical protein
VHTLHCYTLPIMWQEVWTKHTDNFRLVLKLLHHNNMSKRAELYTPTHFVRIVVPKRLQRPFYSSSSSFSFSFRFHSFPFSDRRVRTVAVSGSGRGARLRWLLLPSQ